MLSDYCLPFPPLLVPKGGVSSHRFTELQMYPLHHRKTRSTIAELQSTGSGSGTDTSSERALTKISSSLTWRGKGKTNVTDGVDQGHLRLHPTGSLGQAMLLPISWEVSRGAGWVLIFLIFLLFYERAPDSFSWGAPDHLVMESQNALAGRDLKLSS